MDDVSVITHVLIAIAPAVAVYAGIRADLREAITRATKAQEDADDARRRIDRMMERNR